MLRARGLPCGVEERCRGREGSLKEGVVSESLPGDAALDTGVGLRIVKDT